VISQAVILTQRFSTLKLKIKRPIIDRSLIQTVLSTTWNSDRFAIKTTFVFNLIKCDWVKHVLRCYLNHWLPHMMVCRYTQPY